MLKWFTLAFGLVCAPVALAGDGEPADGDGIALAGDPVAGAVDKVKSDEEAKREERLAALEASQSHKAARVIVLKFQGHPETDYTNETLQRNVKTRTARPDAKFYPEVDLYQVGRKEPDKSVRPADQRATVPATAIGEVTSDVAEVAPIPWNAMTESDWGLKANELREDADKIWFIDRPELREPVFQLYVQIGRAAENQNNPAPPFYAQVGSLTVNWYWYLAGAMAHVEPTLMSKLTDQDLYGSIDYYKQLLDSGQIKSMTLAFSSNGIWDAKAFAGDYQVYINGLEVLIDDKDSLYKVPPGRVDVYLKRSDGHSLSDSIDITKLEEKIYFVRDVAEKKMGIDFVNQLMEHPNECTPELDGDILDYLAIYAKLHPDAEIYIAVPEAGNPNRILLWRWDRPSGTLQKVLDNTGGFPVRFAIIGGTGMAFSGGSVSATVTPPDPDLTSTAPPAADFTPGLTPEGIPFQVQLRGHYGRLLVATGLQAEYGLASDDDGHTPWVDLYQTDGHGTDDGAAKERVVNRLIFMGVGFVLGKDAAIGFGPRGYVRWGTENVPHQMDVTAHGGLTTKGPFDGDGRVKSVVDVDGYIGAKIAMPESLLVGDPHRVRPTFGLVASAGLTF
jgi:hypothetical protein